MAIKEAAAWISSGFAGLIIGAILGLLVTVAFEDRLKRMLDRAIRKMRSLLAKPAAPKPPTSISEVSLPSASSWQAMVPVASEKSLCTSSSATNRSNCPQN
ncbi:hypothetical protein [Dactylosporangium darangshiense]|uniref:hypothetical protein n=1 Tax=Dactylosporangium darangshiense TaxID=579108 RepID=UPI00363AD5D8